MEIKTERLILRDFRPEDINFYIELETHPKSLEFEHENIPDQKILDDNIKQIFELMNDNLREKYSLIIVNKETLIPVGRVVLWKIDDSIHEWEMGWIIHPDYWNNGYASEAAKAMIYFAFKDLNAHRIQALCHEHNHRSERVMISIGMHKEGTLRGVRQFNHQWFGSHIYSILDSDIKKR